MTGLKTGKYNGANSAADFSNRPKFINIEGLQIHYIDEGPKSAPPVLLLHGNPSWSYIFRFAIKKLKDEGARVIAPDLPGFGRSAIPGKRDNFNFIKILKQLCSLTDKLELDKITLYGQDWGALFALGLAVAKEDKISGIIVSNGILPYPGIKLSPLLKLWISFCKYSPWLPADRIISAGCSRKLSSTERKAYKAPFMGRRSKRAIRCYPAMLKGINSEYWWNKLTKWEKPTLTVFSNSDPLTRGMEQIIIDNIPGAVNESHLLVKAGHFIQEDLREELGEIILSFHKKIKD